MIELYKIEDIQLQIDSTAEQLIARCTALLPDASIHHIGSSSIPGALTKGDVDILVVAEHNRYADARRSLDEVFSHNPDMAPEEGFTSYSGCHHGCDYGVQLVAQDDSKCGFLAFRQALVANSALLQEYNAIKRSAQSGSMEDYRAAKAAFVERILSQVTAWHGARAQPNDG
ncbi:hypothetical protein E4634_15275 [Mangrovimicrobium sediminis]|uniref:GrpB family protein n=1 Tax=Mangrovimicrobium sediminis TaxID=2562682 RepID=A0A4Z0LYN0_9GAMM|nr:GrpB family protein [Haliea sp. SAOS-164]TGD72324.1 hypothetical protein E4634_15275 [Haliea sp. SAOS-164]